MKIFQPSILLLAALVTSAAPPARAQAPTPTGQRFVDTTSVVVIEVPVNVIDNGKPVRGLKAEDFRVFDGKKEQELVGFDVIDLEALEGQARPEPVPVPARRRFLLFFDFGFTPRHELKKSIQGARQMLEGLHPSDVVALAAFSRSRGAELLVNFTNDRRQVNAVLDGFGQILDGKIPKPAESGRAGTDPLRLVLDRDAQGSLDAGAFNIAGEALEDVDSSGRAGAIIAENIADSRDVLQVRLTDRVRSQFKEMAGTLADFAAATAGLDGRRFFVFFAHGFDSNIFVDPVGAVGSQGVSRGGASALNNLNQSIEHFRKAGWEIHAVDPATVPDDGNFASVDMLVSMTKETGGTLYRNFGHLGDAMGEMLERTAVTYVLAFQIENVRQDGDYHPIRVELKNKDGLRGAKVLHRAGYTSTKPNSQGIARAVSTAEAILSGEDAGDLDLHTLFVPFRGPGGVTRVASFISTEGMELLSGVPAKAGENLGVEIYAYAVAPNGDIQDFLAQQISVDSAKAHERLKTGNFGMFFDLNLPPGDYDLRMMVRQTNGKAYRLEGQKLHVPDLAGAPHLGGLALFDDLGGSLVIREKAAAANIPYPFVIGENQEFLPATPASVAAVAGVPRRLVLFGYGLRGGGLALNVQLKNAAGQTYDDRLKLVGAAPTGDDGLDRIYLEMRTEGLPLGDYQVEATLEAGGKQEKVALAVLVR